jgi:hypothetical protein
MYGLFPQYEEGFFREVIFALSYTQHGGSGLGWTRTEVLSLPVSEAIWYVERLLKERKAESKAIRAASQKK